MNRRDFISRAAAGATVATLRTASAEASAKTGLEGKPNFLFMIADDLTFRVFEQPLKAEVKTPNLDRLRAQGCAFTHCFHQGAFSGAVCVPSRTMLNTGVSTFKAENAIPANESFGHPTWGQTFREDGYDTFITGKWHLDAVSLQRSFSEQVSVGPGFLPSTPDMYHRPAPGNTWNPADEALKGHWLDNKLWDRKEEHAVQHSSVVYADSAIGYLASRRGKSHPFFMYVGFNAPHDPRQAPQSFLDMYPEDKITVPPNFVPQHPFDQGMADGRDEVLAPFPRTEEIVKTHRREYYAIISHMDQQIGRILDALEASGHAGNTYVILTADHGLAVGEHGLMGKQNQYECSMHMPLLMRGPGIRAGKQVDELVYQHCMYATTCELAGIPVPGHVEFPSLAKMLRSEQPEPIYEATFGWLTKFQRSVRTKKYRMIFYPLLGKYQLFDMENDPWELKDLATDAKYGSVVEQMMGAMRRLQRELGDPLLKG